MSGTDVSAMDLRNASRLKILEDIQWSKLLPAEYRLTLLLHYRGVSSVDIAKLCKVTDKAIYHRIQKAKSMIEGLRSNLKRSSKEADIHDLESMDW